MEWSHCLVSIDICTMNHGTKFSDEEGYDIIPIWMISVLNNDQVGEKSSSKKVATFNNLQPCELPPIEYLCEECGTTSLQTKL